MALTAGALCSRVVGECAVSEGLETRTGHTVAFCNKTKCAVSKGSGAGIGDTVAFCNKTQ